MSIQIANLIKIAGITMLLTTLWAASVAFTYWDVHHRRMVGAKSMAWLALVALLPIFGLMIYLVFRTFTPILLRGGEAGTLETGRETALKLFMPKKNALPTFIASELGVQAVHDPAGFDQANPDQPKNPPKYVITISSGADSGKKFVVDKFPALFGRGPEISIPLDADLGVSRKHAEIFERDGFLRLRDLKSTHGTQVNGSRIDDVDLEPGDRIQVGSTVLTFDRVVD